MKRRTHLLLALLLGVLLQSVAAGALIGGDAGSACAASGAGGPAEPLEPFSRDLTAGTQPFVSGSGPEPLAAHAFPPHALHARCRRRDAPSQAGAVLPSRPVYLTTQRLRI